MKTFYNPKQSALQLAVSPRKLTGSFTIAKSISQSRHVRSGPVPKGTKLFDWDNALTFSVSDEEADEIITTLKKSNEVTIQHFPQEGQQKGTSYLTIKRIDNERMNIIMTRVVGSNKQTVTYTTLNRWQSRAVMRFLQFVADLPQWAELARVVAFNWPRG